MKKSIERPDSETITAIEVALSGVPASQIARIMNWMEDKYLPHLSKPEGLSEFQKATLEIAKSVLPSLIGNSPNIPMPMTKAEISKMKAWSKGHLIPLQMPKVEKPPYAKKDEPLKG